ncbi:peptidoglycan-binding protein [Aliigemmobacter aestuarii]|uniref:Peptidoglycan-binding protein n=1 Tax=Aliigemmobacter aestuarii TaxID=1445661 RepID=A0A4S3MJY7_9RHOB|nr:serine protease [Gemmobacter aestuarii]THD82266.1 peptidoglycan-binding protein [Gemmobacter aestuarii]
MKYMVMLVALVTAMVLARPVAAQDAAAPGQVWLQIEAQPTLREAEDRARAYGQSFPNVAGFRLSSGWYAIVLGPYGAGEAQMRLRDLRSAGLVPGDSYIAEGNSFRDRFWPVGEAGAAAAVEPAPLPEPVEETTLPDGTAEAAPPPPETPAEPAPPVFVDETPAEARRSEGQLDRPAREALQTALQWFGYYDAAIDGAFGPGTRKSMAAWQAENGFDASGVLTTFQRETLLAAYDLAQKELGLQTLREEEAGIEITLPTALVAFDHYEPPFVHFTQKDGSGVSVLLISQPGDQATLYGLYDVLQTLAIMPVEGERERRERSFTMTGRNGSIQSHAFAELSRGLIKGYILSYPVADADRMARVLKAMQTSFAPFGDRAMDPGLVPMSEATKRGLMAGLEVRRPIRSRSGFFVDGSGAVLTTTEAVQGCGRLTIELDHDATVAVEDAALGLALVRPSAPLAPQAVAAFRQDAPRIGGEIAVAGYSYEDQLPSPALTFGRFEDVTGLNGETDVSRLALAALPGDAGGPVLDESGAVIGLLKPAAPDGTRQLPPDVSFAVPSDRILGMLQGAGLTGGVAQAGGAMAPEDLTRLATRMTVLVSCWE